MRPLPLFLNMEGHEALVVGGGRGAGIKVRSLVRAGATVTVIAPRISAEVSSLASRNPRVRLVRRKATNRDVSPRYRLFFPLTDDETLNTALTAEARRKRILVGGSADPARADFAFGATVDVQTIRVVVSTGGASPVWARRLAKGLKSTLRGMVPANGSRRRPVE